MKGVFKEGWHPKGKSGGKESWRGDFKGINQVAGWMGKGKEKEEEHVHVARPLNTLRDPAEFGPPPKRGVVSSQRPIPDRTSSTSSYDRSVQNEPVAVEAESDEGPRPPLPSRPSRTASSTNVPPPPPVRRVKSTADPETVNHILPKPEALPLLPPRLPPRTNSIPSMSPSPPPAYSAASPSDAYSEGYVNQEAASRLSSAGVSVPALGIGNDGNEYGRDNRQRIDPVQQAPVNELQARFSRMTTKSSSSLSPAPLSNYSSPDTPYNSTRSPPPPPPPVSRVDTSRSMSSSNGEGLPRKKAPPPPPPKKASIRALPVNAQASGPPPIPHGTKPR